MRNSSRMRSKTRKEDAVLRNNNYGDRVAYESFGDMTARVQSDERVG
jgi:hypothetical protein